MCFKVVLCVLLCFSCLWHQGYSQEESPCPIDMSINIHDGTMLKNGSIFHNDIVYSKDEYFLHNGTEYKGCICLKKTCLQKCCSDGLVLHYDTLSCTNGSIVFNPPTTNGKNISDSFHVVHGLSCAGYIRTFDEEYTVDLDGSFYNFNGRLEKEKHCIESMKENGSEEWKHVVLGCITDDEILTPETQLQASIRNYFLAAGFLLSFVFLMATFFVYAFVTELRNNHGKCLMNYVLSIGVAFLFMATVKIFVGIHDIDDVAPGVCASFTFISYFFFMASLFWMNVMCIDIYLTFSRDVRMPSFVQNRRFVYYFGYAWGSSMILTAICALLQYLPDVPYYIIRPRIGYNKCWFAGDREEKYYIYMPMSILLACNVVLFILTSLKIVKVKRETSVLREGDNTRSGRRKTEEMRFVLYIKLFLVMGINWLAELTSYFVGGNDYIWILTDFLNTILGVYIFFIFVWKQRIKILMKKRLQSMRLSTNGSKMSSYRIKRNYSNQRSVSDGENVPSTTEDFSLKTIDLPSTEPNSDTTKIFI